MPRYGDLDKLKSEFEWLLSQASESSKDEIREVIERIDKAPTADVVEIETLKAWLYEIAMNNVGCHVDDLASACEEIASRLDGLRVLAGERRNDGK